MNRNRVAGIVLKEGRVLLMFRRNRGKEYFTFPGGGIDPGETLEQALKRELWEETSIEAVPRKLLCDVEWDGSTHQHFFLCDWTKGEPALGDFIEKEVMRSDSTQHYEPMWRNVSDLPGLVVYPLEVKDLFVEGFQNGGDSTVKSIQLKLATCRQSL